jgi:hypothetical protein
MNMHVFLVALGTCAAVSTAVSQPAINFLAVRGAIQTPFDQAPYGRHFLTPLDTPLPSNTANALGKTVSISPGALVYFDSPTVGGVAPFSYQWYLNGSQLVGEVNSTLGYPGVELAPGDYTVLVTDSQSQSTLSATVAIAVDPTFFKVMTDPVVTSYDQRTTSIGCAWGDYNNDGFVDLFTCGGLDGVAGQSQLFHNNGNGTFTQITSGPEVLAPIFGNTACWGDYDNDGNLDLFVATTSVNLLYHNNGAPNYDFSQVSTGSIVTDSADTRGAGWADYDQDGFLDLFVTKFDSSASSRCFLYHNNGDGTFTSDTSSALVADLASSVSCAWADYDNDGRIDLFVCGGRSVSPAPNRLYHNNGDGTFTKMTGSSAGSIATDLGYAGGCAWGDYDGDGWPDLFVMNVGQPHLLYHNNGNGTFTQITGPIVSGSPSGWFYAGNHPISCAWGDYDNDGFLDLFLTDEASKGSGLVLTVNTLYHNNGDGTFTQVTTGSPMGEAADSFGCSWVDYDNDGFLDLFATRGDGRGHYLYHNNLSNTGNTNHWLTIKLVGTVSNRSAIGAKIRVKAFYRGRSRWQVRQISDGSGGGWASHDGLRAHFGLGDATNVDTVRIEWPSGSVQEFHNITPKQILTYTEPPRMLASRVGGVPQFAIKGGRFMQYDIQASTNLSSWSSIGTLTITNMSGIAQIVDTNSPTLGHKFYRAVSH